MVRTRNSAAIKISLGKTPKLQACKAAAATAAAAVTAAATPRSTPSKKRKYTGGNPVHKRDTPAWQKEITCFFRAKDDDQPRTTGDTDDDDDDDLEQRTPPQPGSSGSSGSSGFQ